MTLSEKLEQFRRIAREHGRLPLELEAGEAFIEVASAALLVESYGDGTGMQALTDALVRLDGAIGGCP